LSPLSLDPLSEPPSATNGGGQLWGLVAATAGGGG